MPLVDTHCHLQDRRFEEDREAVIARALEALEWIVVIGDDLANSRIGVELCRERVYAAAGMHPYNASDVDEDAIAQLRALAGHPHVKAIGEIGLDYFNEFSPRADQRRAFPRQLELAIELDLPVVIHDRQADADTLAILDEYRARLTGCVIHCFGSDAVFAAACAERDFYVSFAGNVTFPKAQALRDAAAVVPLERLLIETDAPYLAPQPKRGQRCEPIFVEHTVMTLSDVKCVDLETLVSSTTANARRFFGIV